MCIGSENAGKDVLRTAGVVPGMPLDQAEPVPQSRRWSAGDDYDRPRAGVVLGMLDDEEEEEERERSWAGVVPEAMGDAAEENAKFMATGTEGADGSGSGASGAGTGDSQEVSLEDMSVEELEALNAEKKKERDNRQGFVDKYSDKLMTTPTTDSVYDINQKGYNRNLAKVAELDTEIADIDRFIADKKRQEAEESTDERNRQKEERLQQGVENVYQQLESDKKQKPFWSDETHDPNTTIDDIEEEHKTDMGGVYNRVKYFADKYGVDLEGIEIMAKLGAKQLNENDRWELLASFEVGNELVEKNEALKTASVDRSNYISDEAYLKDMISHGIQLEQAGDDESAEAFWDNNLEPNESVFDCYEKLAELTGPEDFKAFMDEVSIPDAVARKDYTWDPKVTDIGLGTVNVGGEDIGIIAPNSGKDYSDDQVIDTCYIHINDFNGTRFLLNLDFEDKGGLGLPLAQLLNQLGSAVDSVGVRADIVEKDGAKRAVLKLFNSSYAGYEPGDTVDDLTTGLSIYLDEGHRDNPEFGYIYVSGGKAKLVPLIYLEDRFSINGIDCTDEM